MGPISDTYLLLQPKVCAVGLLASFAVAIFLFGRLEHLTVLFDGSCVPDACSGVIGATRNYVRGLNTPAKSVA